MTRFGNRREAGRALGAILAPYKAVHPTVLALPPGGLPVACEVARALDAPLDVLVVGNAGARLTSPIHGQTVIVVDDGMATGARMRVAVQVLRALDPRHIVVAVPVASRQGLVLARNVADDWACVLAPEPFTAVGEWYADFRPVSDEEVRQLLRPGFSSPSFSTV